MLEQCDICWDGSIYRKIQTARHSTDLMNFIVSRLSQQNLGNRTFTSIVSASEQAEAKGFMPGAPGLYQSTAVQIGCITKLLCSVSLLLSRPLSPRCSAKHPSQSLCALWWHTSWGAEDWIQLFVEFNNAILGAPEHARLSELGSLLRSRHFIFYWIPIFALLSKI